MICDYAISAFPGQPRQGLHSCSPSCPVIRTISGSVHDFRTTGHTRPLTDNHSTIPAIADAEPISDRHRRAVLDPD